MHNETFREPLEQRIFKDTKVVLPIITMISMIGCFVWGTYAILEQKHDIDKQLTALGVKIEAVTGDVKDLTKQLNKAVDDRWRRTDMRYWCIEAEAINQGFKCPIKSIVDSD